MNNYGRYDSVTTMKQTLKWPLLQERRFVNRQCMLYKSINDQSALKIPPYVDRPTRVTRRSATSLKFINSNTDVYKYSFFPRTIRGWYHLPTDITAAASLNIFRNRLWSVIQNGQIQVTNPKVTYHVTGPRAVTTYLY